MLLSKILNNNFILKQNKDVYDNYIQSIVIKKNLKSLGYNVKLVPFRKGLKIKKNEVVFNIVETIDGEGHSIYKAPKLLEVHGISFTGGNSKVMKLTTDKLLTKEALIRYSIPTPAWVSRCNTSGFESNKHYIFKPRNEDASIGINSESVFYIDSLEKLLQKLIELEEIDQKEYFAEEYIDGREFNISIIYNNGKSHIFPVAELVFKNFNNNKYKVACYNSKWNEGSFEYVNTYRTFKIENSDNDLINEMKDIALKCWNFLDIKGYARIDLRVDVQNRPKVLEVNSNPCLSLNSGFVAAAFEGGFTYSQILENIISDLNN